MSVNEAASAGAWGSDVEDFFLTGAAASEETLGEKATPASATSAMDTSADEAVDTATPARGDTAEEEEVTEEQGEVATEAESEAGSAGGDAADAASAAATNKKSMARLRALAEKKRQEKEAAEAAAAAAASQKNKGKGPASASASPAKVSGSKRKLVESQDTDAPTTSGSDGSSQHDADDEVAQKRRKGANGKVVPASPGPRKVCAPTTLTKFVSDIASDPEPCEKKRTYCTGVVEQAEEVYEGKTPEERLVSVSNFMEEFIGTLDPKVRQKVQELLRQIINYSIYLPVYAEDRFDDSVSAEQRAKEIVTVAKACVMLLRPPNVRRSMVDEKAYAERAQRKMAKNAPVDKKMPAIQIQF